MSARKRFAVVGITAFVAVGLYATPAAADPSSPDDGCHGFHTTQFKELSGDRGAQGLAIGGRGNSDGDPTNGQAHSEDGRGSAVQEFLAEFCGK